MALFALITFVMGGAIMPVLHSVDHTSDWYDQQAAAHRHGQPASEAMDDACDDVTADLQHCHLCQRDFFSDLVPVLVSSVDLPTGSIFAVVPSSTTLSLDALYPIRAPPLKS